MSNTPDTDTDAELIRQALGATVKNKPGFVGDAIAALDRIVGDVKGYDKIIDEKIESVGELVIENETLKALLRELEWRGSTLEGWSCCPSCGRGEDEPNRAGKIGVHHDDCKLAAVINTKGS